MDTVYRYELPENVFRAIERDTVDLQDAILDGEAVADGAHDAILYIYALLDPSTYLPRYIGQTNDITRRLAAHCSVAYRPHEIAPHADKDAWIRECGGHIVAVKLDEASPHMAMAIERAYIVTAIDAGCSLLNVGNRMLRRERLSREWAQKIQRNIALLVQGDGKTLPLYTHIRRTNESPLAETVKRVAELEVVVANLAHHLQALQEMIQR